MKAIRLTIVLALAIARGLVAQTAPGGCTYDQCALELIPRLSALDVVRGGDGQRVASLSFFTPMSVRAVFAPSAAAEGHADRALAVRRAGAVLTDIGGALALLGVARAAATSDHRRGSIAAGTVGAVIIGVSVPLQFRADAELSRAVHEFNRQFAR